jgi:5-methylthioadenosine/S-adenosylhomocysteine deaminase
MSDLDNSGSDCAAADILVLGGIVVTMDERRTILADARALKLDQLVGSLEPGKRADVVIIDLDEDNLVPLYDPMSHLAYAVEAADVRRVVIDGRVVLRDGVLTTADEREIRRQVRALAIGIGSVRGGTSS